MAERLLRAQPVSVANHVKVRQSLIEPSELAEMFINYVLCIFVYTVFQKSDAKIQITITTAYLIRIKYPLSGFNYHFFDVNFANFNKIHRTVSEQQLF